MLSRHRRGVSALQWVWEELTNLDCFEELLGNDHVRIDIRHVERRRLTRQLSERLHPSRPAIRDKHLRRSRRRRRLLQILLPVNLWSGGRRLTNGWYPKEGPDVAKAACHGSGGGHGGTHQVGPA